MLHTYIVLYDFFEASRKKYLSRVIVDFIILSALHSQRFIIEYHCIYLDGFLQFPILVVKIVIVFV